MYLSKFPIDFQGCFKCGKIDYWKCQFCPLGQYRNQEVKGTFFRELRIHKLWMKDNDKNPNEKVNISSLKCVFVIFSLEYKV